MTFLVDLGRNRPARIQALLEIAKATAYGHQADTLATLARIADGLEVPCNRCGGTTFLFEATPYELPPDEDGERIGLACVPCVEKDRRERTDDERECPDCHDIDRRLWCYAHEKRVPRVSIETTKRVDAALAGMRAAAGGAR